MESSADKLWRMESSAKLLFQGLMMEYKRVLLEGRVDAWARAAHDIVDLLTGEEAVQFAQLNADAIREAMPPIRPDSERGPNDVVCQKVDGETRVIRDARAPRNPFQ